jgi:hypothetical protein
MKLYPMLRKVLAIFPVFVATIAMLTSSCGKSIFSSPSTGGVSTNPVNTDADADFQRQRYGDTDGNTHCRYVC